MLPHILSLISSPSHLDTILTRCLSAFFVSLILMLCFSPRLIDFFRLKQGKGQPIRSDGPQTHLTKKGTPTMGGILILGSIFITSLLCADLTNSFVQIALAVLLVYGFVGFVDDYEKVTKQTANAMSAKMKLFLQFTTALVAVWVISSQTPADVRFQLSFPYFADLALNLSWFYIPFAMVVITGSSNAVNLSDGLDGLASGLMILSFIAFGIIAYFCSYFFGLNVYFIPNAGEISVVCAAIVGALLGFLWFNAKPAQIFMGDVGSLSLGALLGTIAVMTKSEILLAIIGIVFVVEALSVMIQVFWYKRTKTRIFKMAPIHHHFEQLGWNEITVVIRFWIIAFIAFAAGLFSLTCNY